MTTEIGVMAHAICNQKVQRSNHKKERKIKEEINKEELKEIKEEDSMFIL
jgi:hypothetical protein